MYRHLALICLAVAPISARAQDTVTRTRGRDLTRLFYESQFDSLWSQFALPMRQAFRTIDGLKAARGQITMQLGRETAVKEENTLAVAGAFVYQRSTSFEKVPMTIMVQWTLDSSRRVLGFFIRPAVAPTEAPSAFLSYQPKTVLRLPFTGEWFVFWGGRTIADNYHSATADQRFAYDLLIMKNGVGHSGDGRRNEDYYCYGAPILAPAAGAIVEMVDGIADNVPGVMNAEQAMGNHVVINHGNGEFSFLAHFRKGSVTVKAGQQVVAGTPLGECGNSGNSSEPHLHYHLQNSAIPFKGAGLPAPFTGFFANGKPVERAEPVRGTLIRP